MPDLKYPRFNLQSDGTHCERNKFSCKPHKHCVCEEIRATERAKHKIVCASQLRHLLMSNGTQILLRDGELEFIGGNISLLRALEFCGTIADLSDDLKQLMRPAPWEYEPKEADETWFDGAVLEGVPLVNIEHEDAEFRELAGILQYDGGSTKEEAEREARRVIRQRQRKAAERASQVAEHVKRTGIE